jgi:hypothetical protein
MFRLITVLSVAIAAAMTLLACGKPSQTASPTTTANATDNSFTVSVPPGWTANIEGFHGGPPPGARNLLYMTSDSQDRNIAVIAADAGSLTLQQWAQSAMYGVVHVLHGVVDPGGGNQPTTVGGEAALRSSFTAPKSQDISTGVHDQQCTVLHRGVGYIFTFTSKPDEYTSATADFDAVVHSWKWSS